MWQFNPRENILDRNLFYSTGFFVFLQCSQWTCPGQCKIPKFFFTCLACWNKWVFFPAMLVMNLNQILINTVSFFGVNLQTLKLKYLDIYTYQSVLGNWPIDRLDHIFTMIKILVPLYPISFTIFVDDVAFCNS